MKSFFIGVVLFFLCLPDVTYADVLTPEDVARSRTHDTISPCSQFVNINEFTDFIFFKVQKTVSGDFYSLLTPSDCLRDGYKFNDGHDIFFAKKEELSQDFWDILKTNEGKDPYINSGVEHPRENSLSKREKLNFVINVPGSRIEVEKLEGIQTVNFSYTIKKITSSGVDIEKKRTIVYKNGSVKEEQVRLDDYFLPKHISYFQLYLLLLTLSVEALVLWMFGFRTNKFFLAFVCINILTHSIGSFLLRGTFGVVDTYFFVLEFVIFAVEAFTLSFFAYPKEKVWFGVGIANLVTIALGVGLSYALSLL